MSFNVKKGRPRAEIKKRSLSGITPSGYVFHGYSRKDRTALFKRVA